ncbi:MAG: hypothetical protein E6700_01140 [Winkia neuii]|uniref:Oxidoreductase n=1 Tax=Winkia neuii TaxID=33007 RepID=A0A2I1IPU0_9ACTO|nr:hypothetical protein [Winkia neuii]OFJ72150.1 hypothetical protein HMPREF2851_04265 [Actinomyces sp. HMSC064C12]OFK02170.1 hypothetical protein HMPREF2835_07500 [Actinomyces sp. HMSC072A03]OFT54638.1 hypothetical protein HMPREF3152_09215 [Actinomyces sp. HMSC06A08]KWZ74208.1 hypothetical protein HMPREF3198_00766 [Winkia neuii]MDK8098638.1 hypothetical protein [Winkia neuii]
MQSQNPGSQIGAAVKVLATPEPVRQACARADAAVAKLRFHEGLRHRWPQARTEAAVREASASALCEGARIDISELRQAAADGSLAGRVEDASWAIGVGALAAQLHLVEVMAPLNVRGRRGRRAPVNFPALLAGLHRDACVGLLQLGLIKPDQVGLPLAGAGQEKVERARVLAAAAGPAWVRAALVHAELSDAFAGPSGVVARAGARWVMVNGGAEPTGVALVSERCGRDGLGYRAKLRAYRRASPDGVGAWIAWIVEAAAQGAERGADLALEVLGQKLAK